MTIVCREGRNARIVGSLSQLCDAAWGAQNLIGRGCGCVVVHPTESAVSILAWLKWRGGLDNSVALLLYC